MIQPDSNIYLLIAKYSQGNITEQEYHILKAWMEEDAENKRIFSEYLVFLKNAQRVRFSAKVDEHLAWKVIHSKLEKRKTFRIRPYLKYAAVLLVLLSLTVTYQLLHKNIGSEEVLANTNAIQPGKPKAILELGDGRSVKLEEINDSLLAVATGFNIQIKNDTIDYSKSDIISELTNTIHIPRGGEYNLVLSDGTRIWLNSESELTFPAKFKGNQRKISLKGEAYLEVAKNEKLPFIIEVEGAQVEVLGTSFNVKAYENIETTLVEGKVSIRTNSLTEAILNPGEQGVITKESNEITVKQVDTRLYTSWVKGMFAFRSLTLDEIMKTFERWYNVTVTFENDELKQRRFTGNLKRNEEINPHLDVISLTTDVEFEISGEKILVKKS
ncbi:FecR domain-containing protein [uncultured Draconibacterium sp.]|uniref:FecR family protein n=1 Tax=uncultured Draconibacterium sp. TaxID=1573823 RepID=UPI0029C68E78|nr:FecR domain-containing protein [uncultured Draconibacterium sp.]